jgi:hypothetical protein
MPDPPAPEPVAEAVPEADETSDLGSPGFNTSQPHAHPIMPHHPDTTGFGEAAQDVPQDLYQSASSGLSYPQDVGLPEDMPNTDYFQSRNATDEVTYPQPSRQASDGAYAEGVTASQQQAQGLEPVLVQPSQTPAKPNHQSLPRNAARRSLPSGSGQHQADYANSTNANPAPSWQSTDTPENFAQAYPPPPATSQNIPPRQNEGRQSVAPNIYDTTAQDALQAATTLTQAALQKRPNASPITRTVSPFAIPTQAVQVARAKSRQAQRGQSRQTTSPFQQTTASQPPAVAAASSLYNTPSATDSDNVPNYDQYSRYGNTPNLATATGSRVAYEPYSQQAAANSSATSYSGYGTYDSRSQASNLSSLPNPVTQGAGPSYTKTAAPSSKNWTGGNERRSSSSYSSNKASASSTPTYNVSVSDPTQSRTSGNTSASYAQQPRQQHSKQPSQQTYNSYSSQTPPATDQQQPSPQQQHWYGFGSTSNATSTYGGSGYGQHRSMNLAGNTYTSINDQEVLYEMLRNNPRQ